MVCTPVVVESSWIINTRVAPKATCRSISFLTSFGFQQEKGPSFAVLFFFYCVRHWIFASREGWAVDSKTTYAQVKPDFALRVLELCFIKTNDIFCLFNEIQAWGCGFLTAFTLNCNSLNILFSSNRAFHKLPHIKFTQSLQGTSTLKATGKTKIFRLLYSIVVLIVVFSLSDSLSSLTMELKLLKSYLGIHSC